MLQCVVLIIQEWKDSSLLKLESDNITKFVGHLCIGYFVFTCSLDRKLLSLLSTYHFYSQYFI